MSRMARVVTAIWSFLFVFVGCSSTEDTSRQRALDAPNARLLVGAWDARFTLDQPLMVPSDSTRPRPVTGVVAFVEARHVAPVIPQLSGSTHDVAYDIDFRPFGFDVRDRGASPIAAARTSERDSVTILLGADETLFSVRAQGAFIGDSVSGVWTAESPRSAGAGGRFSMHRRRMER